MSERPDPLAPPEGYGSQPAHETVSRFKPASLDECAQEINLDRRHCDVPPAETQTWGCRAGEHICELSFCEPHAVRMIRNGDFLRCGQCDPMAPMRLLRRVSYPDGRELPPRGDPAAEAKITEMFS